MSDIKIINDEKMLENAAGGIIGGSMGGSLGGSASPALPTVYCKACGKAALYVRHDREGGSNVTYFKCTNPECKENGIEKEAPEFDTVPCKI